MNDEEEAAMEVMQESHPPSLIEEQPQPETNLGTEQVERGDQFQAFEAAGLVEAEKVEVIEDGGEVGDSSSLAERSVDVIIGADIPAVKDELVAGNGGEGGDKASLLTAADSVALVEEEESAKVKEANSVGETATEGEGQVEEDEKLGGGVESQTAMKQDNVSNIVEETAKVDENTGGERKTEEVDGSEVNGDYVLTVASHDCETMEEGKTPPVEIGSKVVNESEIELKVETGEMEGEEKKEIKEGQAEAKEKEVETEKVEYGREEVVVAEDTLVKDEQIQEKNESEREDVLTVTMAEKEDGLIAEVEDMIAVQKDGDGQDGSVMFKESLPAGLEGGESRGERKGLEEEKSVGNDSGEVKGVSPFGGTATEGNQADVRTELSEEEEAPKAKELLPFGEEEKLDGDREAQIDKKQDNKLNVGEETAKIDEKMGGDREMEEVDSSQINADGLFPEPVHDSGVVEDGKTQALGTETKVVKESEIELKEGTKEMEVEEREIKTEESHLEAKEDKEMDGEAEKEMEAEERGEAPKSGSGKRKRGRNSKSAVKAPLRKIVGEDVCFICLDGGDLVLCDRRGCPKAYHPSCVDRDEAFFRSKGLWNCGWHLCKQCKKNAYYMCYTCQCSLCKGCLTDDATFFCVRGSKGLCQTCMKSVILIENNEGNDGMATFDDKSSMDYLFKDYWIEQKEKLSLTSDEIALVINRWKRSNADHNQERLPEAHAGNTEGGAVSDSSLGTAEATKSEREKSKKRIWSSTMEADYDADGSAGKAEATGTKQRGRRRLKSQPEGADPNLDNSSKEPRRKKAKKLSQAHALGVESTSHMTLTNERTSSQSSTEWASKELLEFVAHVKNGDKSALSQFDVQELLVEYVKRNKLRDPRRSGQIVCDAILQKLFGMPRLGHIEMLKLLESHFFVKEDSQGDDNQGSVLDVEVSQLGTDENTDSFMDVGKSRGRKARKRADNKGLQSNLDDYAAIDMHNINLIYLRRNLIEALMEDGERLHEKVVGSFVRIKITGSNQKQDIYRLVQVIGTPKAPSPYKVGKRIADCMLEILNLNKTDVIPIDIISNQDFDEDECKRLRQSIKCGFLSRLTVGDVLDKAKDLHVVRVIDLLETEITRINHLRDRASDLGRKKELRECVEKSLLLNTPEERQRRLDEIPVVHADPKMDPSHESEDESEPEKGRDSDMRLRETSFSRREREHFPSRKGDSPSTDSWSSTSKSPSKKWESTRSLSGKGFSSRSGDAVVAEEALSGRPWSTGRDKMSSQSTNSEKLTTPPDSLTGKQGQLAETRTNASASTPSETSLPSSTSLVQNETKISETEKLWHYKDPTAKVQGPFSIVQLRKWNKNGYFPANLRIWRTAQSEDDSILLTEALAGRFEEEPSQPVAKPVEAPSAVHRGPVNNTLKVDQNRGAGITRNTTDQLLPIVQRSQSDPRFSSNDSANRPTSSQCISPGATERVRVSRWSGSLTPVQLPSTPTGAGPLPGAKGMIPSPAPDSYQVRKSSSSPSYEPNRAFDRPHSTHQSSREAVSLPRNREDERLGSVYAQKPSSQPTVAPGPPRVHVPTQQTLQSVSDTAAVSSNNNSHGSTNNVVQPTAGQNPASSAHGWESGGYVLRPEMMNSNNTNATTQQGQQQAYCHWPTTPAPPYGAGQPTSSGNFLAQNFSALPSQAPWTPQVPAAQPNVQLVGTAAAGSQDVTTTQLPGNAGWAQMQAYLNTMGWVAPNGPSPSSQFAPQQGATAGAAMVQASGPALGMQLGNMNPGWVAPAANPGVAGPWNNWQPPQGGSGMVAPGPQITNGQRVCPYLLQGHCQKGPTCDFRHS